MTASTPDTLSAMDELREAGFDERQARAIIGVLQSAAQCCATRDGQATSAHETADWFTAAWVGGCIGFLVGATIAPGVC